MPQRFSTREPGLTTAGGNRAPTQGIAEGIVGAINRNPGDTGSAALNAAAVERARLAGTPIGDLLSSVGRSRARTLNTGIGDPLAFLPGVGLRSNQPLPGGGGNPIDTGIIS